MDRSWPGSSRVSWASPYVLAVIPARYSSTRFPGKPLADRTGKPLIQHVYERVMLADSVGRVVVATDDRRIYDAVERFGGDVVMTRADHVSGTDRVAEVAARIECDIVVNVQGDEPEIEPSAISHLVGLLQSESDCPMATLACPFSKVPNSDPDDPHAVKVVLDSRGRALYFSRSRIPYARSRSSPAETLLHLGIYAYRRGFLMELTRWRPTPLECSEGLEQLRVLENGGAIAVGVVDRAAVGIDTPEDYEAFVERTGCLVGEIG